MFFSMFSILYNDNENGAQRCELYSYDYGVWIETLNLQGRAKERLLSCEKVLPGCAWLLLNKKGPFSAQACIVLQCGESACRICAHRNGCMHAHCLPIRGCRFQIAPYFLVRLLSVKVESATNMVSSIISSKVWVNLRVDVETSA